eukprot:4583500-Amphidinium_carterae.2
MARGDRSEGVCSMHRNRICSTTVVPNPCLRNSGSFHKASTPVITRHRSHTHASSRSHTHTRFFSHQSQHWLSWGWLKLLPALLNVPVIIVIISRIS